MYKPQRLFNGLPDLYVVFLFSGLLGLVGLSFSGCKTTAGNALSKPFPYTDAQLRSARKAIDKMSMLYPGFYLVQRMDTVTKTISDQAYYVVTPIWTDRRMQGEYWYYEESIKADIPFEPVAQLVVMLKEHTVDSVIRIPHQIKSPERFKTGWANPAALEKLEAQDLNRQDPACHAYFVEKGDNLFELQIDDFCPVNLGQVSFVKAYQRLTKEGRCILTNRYNAEKRVIKRELTKDNCVPYNRDLGGNYFVSLQKRWLDEQAIINEQAREAAERAKKAEREAERGPRKGKK